MGGGCASASSSASSSIQVVVRGHEGLQLIVIHVVGMLLASKAVNDIKRFAIIIEGLLLQRMKLQGQTTPTLPQPTFVAKFGRISR